MFRGPIGLYLTREKNLLVTGTITAVAQLLFLLVVHVLLGVVSMMSLLKTGLIRLFSHYLIYLQVCIVMFLSRDVESCY
jgi:hypothetical protein